MGGNGNIDATGPVARFDGPYGTAVDAAGNVFVADRGNSTIRKISPGGEVTTVAGTSRHYGSLDGTGASAEFNQPDSIAVDVAGNLYVADTMNNTIRKISTGGVVSTLAGTAGQTGTADGAGNSARFNQPSGVAVDAAGNVYVADSGNNTIRVINTNGVVSTLAGSPGVRGNSDGTGGNATFSYPEGVTVDSTGTIYVADGGNQEIRKITSSGVVTTVSDSSGAASNVDGPTSLAVDSSGNLYVTTLQVIFGYVGNVKKVTPAGVVSLFAGSSVSDGWIDGTGTDARFSDHVEGMSIDTAGNLYVADAGNDTIRKIDPNGVVTTIAGLAPHLGVDDGTGTAATFSSVTGLAVDGAGNLYVADNPYLLRKITAGGVVTSVGGVDSVSAVAADAAGNMYVADAGGHVVDEINTNGDITTLAGSPGQIQTVDGVGSNAGFNGIYGMVVGNDGNIYIADGSTVRRLTPDGTVTTIAGSPNSFNSSTDGVGTSATFSFLQAMTEDAAGNLYVVDRNNDTVAALIRKITPAGVVTTLAGSLSQIGSNDGAGSNATFNNPQGITVDTDGNLYVADTFNGTIRKITPAGMVTTVVGETGTEGFIPGSFPGNVISYPLDVAVVGDTLYITTNNSILVVATLP